MYVLFDSVLVCATGWPRVFHACVQECLHHFSNNPKVEGSALSFGGKFHTEHYFFQDLSDLLKSFYSATLSPWSMHQWCHLWEVSYPTCLTNTLTYTAVIWANRFTHTVPTTALHHKNTCWSTSRSAQVSKSNGTTGVIQANAELCLLLIPRVSSYEVRRRSTGPPLCAFARQTNWSCQSCSS